jgi:type VI secretion system secreted protein VgrG
MADELSTVRGEVEIDGEAYRLLACRVREAISEVPVALIEITTLDSANNAGPPDPAGMVGKAVKLTLHRSDDSVSRVFVGSAVEVTRLADEDGRPFTRLRVSPRLFRLGKRRTSRTFQEKSVPEIVAQVLTEAGIAATDQESKLSGSYDPRVYCVQYRESDLDFVQRLLAEEGIYFTTRFDGDTDKVVLGDDPEGLGDIEGTSALPFAGTYGFVSSKEHVMWVREEQSVRPDKTFTRAYDFERPKLALEGKAEGKDPGEHALEVYAWPGRFLDPGVGQRYAELLLDAMQAERDIVTGESTVLTMAPGRRFTLSDHPYEALNQEYLITALVTEVREGFSSIGSAAQRGKNYGCTFTAIPTARSPYRPPRIARAQVIAGVQTAVTTGPSGGEIHTDKHGRVKIKYMWDRLGKDDDTSSCWVRTSQVPTGGSMLLPRVGWEVSVRHVEGDPDEPLVMTRLYNAVTPPPYALPGGKARGAMQTATTPGGGSSNEFRMDDSKGKEEVMFNASRDMTIDVVNNATESIGNNETRSIGSNHAVNVTNSVTASVGGSQTTSVGGDQTVHVETFLVEQVGGDHALSIGGNRDLKIGGDHKRQVGGDASTQVGSLQTDLVVGSVTDQTSGNMTRVVGTAAALLTVGDHSLTVGGNRSESTTLAKAVIAFGGKGVEIGGTMMHKVAGAILTKIDADRADQAGADYTEVAAGAQILKADHVVFEADTLLSFVMGASTITLTPVSISIAGLSIKIDGAVAETAALVADN